MKPELEQIAACDEKARARLETAKVEAKDILDRARHEAEAIYAGLEESMALMKKDEIKPIIDDAEIQAKQKTAQAYDYMDRFRSRVETHRERIIALFMDRVINGALPYGQGKEGG